MDPRTTRPLTPLLLAICLGACAVESDDTCITDRRLAANGVSLNKLAGNRLAANKLGVNGLFAIDLPEVALTSVALAEVLDEEVLADDFAQEVLAYTVSCALAPGQSVDIAVDGDVHTLEGSLGLAPQWGESEGSCDAECQGWVSACLIARTNFEGVSLEISLLGDHPSLEPSDEESLMFDIEEATYFGGLFGSKQLYGCVPAGSNGPERTCGDDPSSCPIEIVGACEDLCDASGCRNAQGDIFAETITVNLRNDAATCG